jgi:predicted secreted Zn-dependent protease
VINLRKSALLCAAIVCCAVLIPARAHAQWWGARAPADYEECAESAEKAATKEAKATQLAECGVKFAARRKPGGGYSYFDFMQNRHFDIAGPNPTPEEQRHIDEQYAEYLSRERRSAIATAFTQKQQQLQRAAPESEKKSAIPVPVSRPRVTTVGYASPRPANAACAKDSFSCNWPRLAAGIKDFKKLFGSSPDKARRSRSSTELATSNQ